jgi:hypothetical protein
MITKIVDIYVPLDSRKEANKAVWPVAKKQLGHLVNTIYRCGWKANILNPNTPISSVAQGMGVIKKAKGQRFINFLVVGPIPIFP